MRNCISPIKAILIGFLWSLLMIPADILTRGFSVLGLTWMSAMWEFGALFVGAAVGADL